jgi:predicted nucleotidyltransferase
MRTPQDLSDTERRLVADLHRRIGAELTDIGFRMTVFGSRARGDAEPDSDMDVLIDVDVDHISFADKRRLRRIATDVSIASGIVVMVSW